MRRMKQLKAAKRALEAPTAAALQRGIDKRAKVRSCPYCDEKFDNARSVSKHLEKSGCLKRWAAKEKRARGRGHSLVDPRRPELGKVVKGSLVAKLLAQRD